MSYENGIDLGAPTIELATATYLSPSIFIDGGDGIELSASVEFSTATYLCTGSKVFSIGGLDLGSVEILFGRDWVKIVDIRICDGQTAELRVFCLPVFPGDNAVEFALGLRRSVFYPKVERGFYLHTIHPTKAVLVGDAVDSSNGFSGFTIVDFLKPHLYQDYLKV